MASNNSSILPEPFNSEEFSLLRKGIYDDPDVDVYLNQSGDFAFLDPRVETEYSHYQPRVGKLGLETYKKTTNAFVHRLKKVESVIGGAKSLLEIGAGDGGFLQQVREQCDGLALACIEPDLETEQLRRDKSWLVQYHDFAEIGTRRFDVVCLFHVLEHLLDPAPLLRSCAAVIEPGGCLVIEVPSLDDPLLSIYEVPSYREFFFQKQHPYYYTASSLDRLLVACGFEVEALLAHQRYGLENHLNWLQRGAPGGNRELRELFATAERAYRESLEVHGKSDAVIAVVRC